MSRFLEVALREEILGKVEPYFAWLRKVKVDHIGYREFCADGNSRAFCSHLGWYKVKIDEQMHQEMAEHYAKEIIGLQNKQFKFCVRNKFLARNKFLQALLAQNMCNSLIVYQQEPKIIRMYAFISYLENVEAINYFFNLHNTIEQIMESYSSIIAQIIEQPKYEALRRPLFTDKVTSKVFTNNTSSTSSLLTATEEKYAKLIALGATNKDIASQLGVSTNTVKYHLTNIKFKLKTNSRLTIIEYIKDQQHYFHGTKFF